MNSDFDSDKFYLEATTEQAVSKMISSFYQRNSAFQEHHVPYVVLYHDQRIENIQIQEEPMAETNMTEEMINDEIWYLWSVEGLKGDKISYLQIEYVDE